VSSFETRRRLPVPGALIGGTFDELVATTRYLLVLSYFIIIISNCPIPDFDLKCSP
jgi:hypothetical protein